MHENKAYRLGKYIKDTRINRGITGRELARRASVDTAYIVRLERGEYRQPRPETLKNIAAVLGLPLADVFALANYVIPYELPEFAPYLRAKYGDLPEQAVDELSNYFTRVAKTYGFDPNGPAPGEDEQPITRPEDIAAEDLQ